VLLAARVPVTQVAAVIQVQVYFKF